MNDLIKEFLEEYSFNNIEVLLNEGSELSLDDDLLYQKIIKDKRGGYCFENNQVFYNLLLDKGFKAKRLLARVVYGKESSLVPRTHQFSLVEVQGRAFIADVGFGPYTPGIAIPMSGELIEAFNGNSYRVEKVDHLNYQLQTLRDDEFFALYEFDLGEYNQADFKLSNYYTSTHPKSKFTTSLIVSKLTDDGVKFLNNRTLSILKKEEREDREVESLSDLEDILEQDFNLNYSKDELQTLFQKIQSFEK